MKIKSNADMKTSTSSIALAINSNGDVSPEVPSEVTARSDIETVVRAKFPLLDIDSIVWRHDSNVATWQIPKIIRRRLNETETRRTIASNDSGLNDLSSTGEHEMNRRPRTTLRTSGPTMSANRSRWGKFTMRALTHMAVRPSSPRGLRSKCASKR